MTRSMMITCIEQSELSVYVIDSLFSISPVDLNDQSSQGNKIPPLAEFIVSIFLIIFYLYFDDDSFGGFYLDLVSVTHHLIPG